jgi:NifU-like protein involved in Fe-S cluster formation
MRINAGGMNYNDLTRRHFESAANAGVLTGVGIRRGAAGSRAQGTWVQFDVQVAHHRPDRAHEPPTVSAVRFLAFGCPHVIAVADRISQQAVGKVATAALPEDLESLRELFAVPVEKLGRLLIVEDAWIAAVSAPC